MDERRWLASENLSELIAHLRETANVQRKKAGRRKLLLLACACARQMWGLMCGPNRALVEGIELLADGRLTKQELEARHAETAAAASEEERDRLGTGDDAITGYLQVTADHVLAVTDVAAFVSRRLAYVARREAQAAGHGAAQIEDALRRASQARRRACELAREIFGNPFSPLPPRKFPAEVRGLAQSCYEDAAHYPLLADALADLGEADAAEHCRRPGHVRGCHVVDWVLGRQ
jgi:hypothetical protein